MGNHIPTFRGTYRYHLPRREISQKIGTFYFLPRLNTNILYDFYSLYFTYILCIFYEISYLWINVNFENTDQNFLISLKHYQLRHAAKHLTHLQSCSRLCILGSLVWQLRHCLNKNHWCFATTFWKDMHMMINVIPVLINMGMSSESSALRPISEKLWYWCA